MNTLQTVVGEIKWEGVLSPDTWIHFNDGTKATLSNWITMTNGRAIQWIETGQNDSVIFPNTQSQISEAQGVSKIDTVTPKFSVIEDED